MYRDLLLCCAECKLALFSVVFNKNICCKITGQEFILLRTKAALDLGVGGL